MVIPDRLWDRGGQGLGQLLRPVNRSLADSICMRTASGSFSSHHPGWICCKMPKSQKWSLATCAGSSLPHPTLCSPLSEMSGSAN